MRAHRAFLALSFALVIGQRPVMADNFVVTTSQVPLCTADQNAAWEQAVANQQGLEVRDPEGHWISGYPVVHRDFWSFNEPVYRPWSVVKRTLCGQIGKYGFTEGTWSDEADWNIYLLPTAAHMSLLTDPINRGASEIHDCNGGRNNCMEAEITPDEWAYNNPFFPRSGTSPLIGETICVYGPWVSDCDHGGRPEIHPSEVLWWREDTDFIEWTRILLVQEDSNRFDRFSMGDWYYETGPYPHPDFQPWSQAPRRLDVRFPFESMPGSPVFRFDIHQQHRRRITTASPPDVSADSDDGSQHALEYNGRVVAAANELQEINSDLGVTFGDLCRNGSALRGFVQLAARLGENDHGKEGFMSLLVGKMAVETSASPPDLPPSVVAAQLLTQPSEEGVELTPGPRGNGPAADLPFEIVPVKDTTLEELTVRSADLIDPKAGRVPVEVRLTQPPREGQSTVGVFAALPVLPEWELEVTTAAGKIHQIRSAGNGLTARLVDLNTYSEATPPGLWKNFALAAGGRDNAVPGELASATVLELSLAVRYVPMRNGEAQGEEGSGVTRLLNEVVREADATRRISLFGSDHPLVSSWSLEALDLANGQRIPVVASATPREGEVGYEVLVGKAPAPDQLRLIFPPGAASSLIDVEVQAEVRDPFGNVVEARGAFTNQVLRVTDGADGLMKSAAEMRGVATEALLASSQLELGPRPFGAELDRHAETARMVRMVALRTLEDERVTVAELADLLGAIDLYAASL